MVQPGEYVIDNNKKVNGIVTAIDSNQKMAQLYRYDLNEYKPPLKPSIYIYQPFDSITVKDTVKEQSGGTGQFVQDEEGKYDNHFHIIDVELNEDTNGLYGYFKDGYLEFEIMHFNVSRDTNTTIEYDVIYKIIIGTEFQDIISTNDDIERKQLAYAFLNKVKHSYNVIKFSLNQTRTADATVERLKKDIEKACKSNSMTSILIALSEAKLIKKKNTNKKTYPPLLVSEGIEGFIKDLEKCVVGDCEKKKLTSLFKKFCGGKNTLTTKVRGETQMSLNTPIDHIINAFLPDKNTLPNITLLKNVTYNNNEIGLDQNTEMGKLFNMEYDIEEKTITKATLSYNLIGFLMLMTELEHDFYDVKEIKKHLPTINKNFLKIAELMKNELINNDTRDEILKTADNTLFNNVFYSLEKENPKLKEEEMGRIITALLCNDDMPRVIAADDKVYLQYYAPKSLKGNMPAFYNIRQINKKNKEEVTQMEQFLEYTFNNESDNEMSFEEFKMIRYNIETDFKTQKANKKRELDDKREEEKTNKSEEEKAVIGIKYDSLIKASNEKYDIFIGLQTTYNNSYVNTKSVFNAYDSLKEDVETKIEGIDNNYDTKYNIIKDEYDNKQKTTEDLENLTQFDNDFEKDTNELFTQYSRDINEQNKRLTVVNQLLELDGITESVNDLVKAFTDSKPGGNPFMEDIMTFYNTDINFTSDADNKAAYVLANSKNMKPITKEKHPFLSLDAGASPQLPINNEYYDWFNRLHNEHKQDPINPPTIVVKNPLNGSDLVTITYIVEDKMYNLLIQVTEQVKITDSIKDLNKTTMSDIMKIAIDYYNDNVDENSPKETDVQYQLLLFGASILKSLGDLVCYITVNMQEFLLSEDEDQKENMYLCNSADYSMYYPLLGNFSFNKDNEIARKYSKTNMYLSCSIKSMQNFFVPLTLHEQIKLYLIKLLNTENPKGFQVLEEVLSFEEKYGRPGSFHNKTIYKAANAANAAKDSNYNFELVEHEESIPLFIENNYNAFKDAYQKEQENSLLYAISEMYLVFVYLSKLYYFQDDDGEVGDLQGILQKSELLHQLKVLNRDIFQEQTFDLQNTRRQWERLDLIADYNRDKKGLVLSANNRMRRSEILESFLLKEEVQFTDVEINRDSWKYSYLYATILKKVGDNDAIYSYLNNKVEKRELKEATIEANTVEEEKAEEEAAARVAAEEAAKKAADEEAADEDDNFGEGAEEDVNNGGKRRNKSKKNGKKSNKRQTRKVNK